ncbi:hypothetical protein [Lacinutrix sp. Bg11-31]|uniref:hypothetical protein n=1 Tax=Lacinutrix sp. Bg11-31 TaxID=2057808 RepID=UPI000C31526C|nr:hypothetical protein [Lacinutrix sp. Bg11-31]AUC81150.1 hypothetical protein CW733_02985 [Lacinutrix sp. Bg11-31]
MTHVEKPDIVFYQSLGELFYAIAASDKTVKAEEYEALLKMVLLEWKIYENIHEFYDEAAGYQMEFVFKWFDYEHMDAQDSFKNFCEYARKNSKLFTKNIIKLILKTTESIASAFASKNKSELIMLAQLQILFKELSSKNELF